MRRESEAFPRISVDLDISDRGSSGSGGKSRAKHLSNSPGYRVREWCAHYLSRRKAEGASGAKKYEEPIFRLFIDDTDFGRMRLKDVTRSDARAWWTCMSRRSKPSSGSESTAGGRFPTRG